MLSTKYSFQSETYIQTKSEGMGKDIHTNRNQKKVEVAVLISGKIDKKQGRSLHGD